MPRPGIPGGPDVRARKTAPRAHRHQWTSAARTRFLPFHLKSAIKMPSTTLKHKLRRVIGSPSVLHALFHAGSQVRAAGRAMFRRTEWMSRALAVPRRTWALTSTLLHGDHVSMKRRVLLVCLALYAGSHAHADNTPAVDSSEVASLIEALRPLPVTRGIDPHPKLASAALSIEFEPGSVRLTEQGRRSLDTLGTALRSSEL